jgi:hypothetical protein
MPSLGIETKAEEALPVFTGSEFLQSQGFAQVVESLTFTEGRLSFPPGVVQALYAG